MKTRKTVKLDRSTVSIRLGVCAAALSGTAALVPEAQAQIVTFNTPIPIPQTFAGVYINLQNGTSGPSSAHPGWDFNPYAGAAATQLNFFWNNAVANTAGGVATSATAPTMYRDLPVGEIVGPASTFTAVIAGTVGSPFHTTGTHILGFRFFNEVTSVVNFGYLTMTNNAPLGFPSTVDSWAYDASGAPIAVGAIPEPSSMLLTGVAMAAGARGVRKWRKQRAAA